MENNKETHRVNRNELFDFINKYMATNDEASLKNILAMISIRVNKVITRYNISCDKDDYTQDCVEKFIKYLYTTEDYNNSISVLENIIYTTGRNLLQQEQFESLSKYEVIDNTSIENITIDNMSKDEMIKRIIFLLDKYEDKESTSIYKEYYGIGTTPMSLNELSKKYGCSIYSISKKISKISLYLYKRCAWNREDTYYEAFDIQDRSAKRLKNKHVNYDDNAILDSHRSYKR